MDQKGFKKGVALFITFVMIIMLTPVVKADEFNMNNYTSATSGGTKNRYRGTEIYNTGQSSTYTFGTRYNGRLSDIETYFSYPFEANTTYRFTYNMATNDFNNNFGSSYWWDCDDTMTNNNAHVFIPTYVSYKKIQFSIKPSDNTTCIRVWVRSPNLSSGNITQISNWNLSSITLYDPDWQSGSGGGQGTSPTPTATPGASNQDIIDSQNNNTQDIINNQNDNTNNIIDNNNENTQKIIDSMSTDCPNLINLQSLNLFRSGERTYSYVFSDNLSAGTYTMTYDYYSVFSPEVQVQVYLQGVSGTTKIYVLSNSGKLTFTMPNAFNRMYFYITNESDLDSSVLLENFMLVNGSSPISYCEYGSKLSKIDESTHAINEVNNSINNDNIDNGVGSNFFNDFNTTDNGGISAIVTKPLMIVNNLLTNNGQCANLTLPEFMGVSTAYLPSGCVLWNNATPTMISLWNIFVCGLGSYFILKDIFRIIENLKNPDNDKVEVMDL